MKKIALTCFFAFVIAVSSHFPFQINANAGLLNDSIIIEKYNKELKLGNLKKAYKYIKQVKMESAQMSGINIIFQEALFSEKCSLAKIIIDDFTEGEIKDYSKMQYGLSC
jgi:hypothetical protein